MSTLGSGRSEGDSWDVVSSVGATATVVAAGRAMASRGPDPLLDDPFAEPLVRAVGHEFFTKLMDDEISLEHSDSPMTEQQRREQMAVRTRFSTTSCCRRPPTGFVRPSSSPRDSTRALIDCPGPRALSFSRSTYPT